MQKLEAAFGPWVIKYRWLLIPLMIGLVVLAAAGAQKLVFKPDYRVFFSEENPQLQAFDAMERTYTKDDNVLIVLSPADGNVFSSEMLTVVEQVTTESWQIPYSIRVDSITNFQYTYAEEDDLIVENLVTDARSLTTEDLVRIKEISINEPLLVHRLISPDAHVTAVNVTIQMPGINQMLEVPEVVAYARQIKEQIQAEHPSITVHLSGMAFMNNAFSETAQLDFKTLVPISFGVMLLCLALLLRGFTGTVATFSVILFSILGAMGLSGHLGMPLTPSSSVIPIIILTVAIANSVHILVTFYYEMRKGQTKQAAMTESLRINLQPVFLTSLTTAIGFLTMNFSEVPPFQYMGNTVAMGVGVSFLLSVTLLPALMMILPVRVKTTDSDQSDIMDKLGDFVVGHYKQLLVGMSVFVIALVAFLPNNELNDEFVKYFDERIEFRTDTDYITDNLTGIYNINYSLQTQESGGISDPNFLAEEHAFAEWLREQPEVLHVSSITDIFKRLNKNMHEDDPAWYRLPDSRELAAQYLLLYEMSLPYGLDLNNQIDVDKSSTRLSVTLYSLSTSQMLDIEQRAGEWLAANTSHIKKYDAASPNLMFAHISKRNIVSMLTGTTLALILISAILMVALRSVKMGLVSMVPNLVPAAMGFGLWGIWVGEVGLALSIVTGMTLGIVVDDTVHFLSKYLRAKRERNATAPEAVRYAFHNVGRALLYTSIILVAGFAILATSAFKLNSGMGMLSAIIITFALIADFLLLPALLIKLEEKRDAKALDRNTAASTNA